MRQLPNNSFASAHQVVYNKPELVKDIYSALYASKLVSYAQGFAVLQKASESFGWDLDLASIARMWRGGCIIRSIFLNDIAAAFEAQRSRNICCSLLISGKKSKSCSPVGSTL